MPMEKNQFGEKFPLFRKIKSSAIILQSLRKEPEVKTNLDLMNEYIIFYSSFSLRPPVQLIFSLRKITIVNSKNSQGRKA